MSGLVSRRDIRQVFWRHRGQQHLSYLGTGLHTGTVLPTSSNTQLAAYTVIDDLGVPPEYGRYVIVHWGGRVFQNPDDYVGYNVDSTTHNTIGRILHAS